MKNIFRFESAASPAIQSSNNTTPRPFQTQGHTNTASQPLQNQGPPNSTSRPDQIQRPPNTVSRPPQAQVPGPSITTGSAGVQAVQEPTSSSASPGIISSFAQRIQQPQKQYISAASRQQAMSPDAERAFFHAQDREVEIEGFVNQAIIQENRSKLRMLEDFVNKAIIRENKIKLGLPAVSCTAEPNYEGELHPLRVFVGGDDEQVKTAVESKLAKFGHYERLAKEGFEIIVSFDAKLGFCSAGDSSSLLAALDTNKVYIDLDSEATSLCGATIYTESVQASPALFTCGGLISVDGLLYALSVAHPLMTNSGKGTMTAPDNDKEPPDTLGSDEQSSEQLAQQPALSPPAGVRRGTDGDMPNDATGQNDIFNTSGAAIVETHYRDVVHTSSPVEIDDAVLAHLWRPLGRITETALSDSVSVPINSDWMLIEVDSDFLLPNTMTSAEPALRLGFVDSGNVKLGSQNDLCHLHSSRGVLEGRLQPGQSLLTIGAAQFRTSTIALNSSLEPGDSGTWVSLPGDSGNQGSQGDILFGVVVARGGAHVREQRGNFNASPYTALVIRIEDVFASISRLSEGAVVRLPTSTEIDIVVEHRACQRGSSQKEINLPMAHLYARDICKRFMDGRGSTSVAQMSAYVRDADIEIRPFLAIGQAFPLTGKSRSRRAPERRLKWTRRILTQVYKPLFSPPTVPILSKSPRPAEWVLQQLFGLEGGENFTYLLMVLRDSLNNDPEMVWRFMNCYLERLEYPAPMRPSFGMVADLCDIIWHQPSWVWKGDPYHFESPSQFARLLALLRTAEKTDSFLVCKGNKAFVRMLLDHTDVNCVSLGPPGPSYKEIPRLKDSLRGFPRVFFIDSENEDSAALISRSPLYRGLVTGKEDEDQKLH